MMDNQQDPAGHNMDHFLYVCDICGKKDLNDIEMKMHMATTHRDDFVCLFCDLKGVTPDEMTLHINSVHFDDNLLMKESRDMEVEQNCDGYTLMKNNDYIFNDTKDSLSMSTDDFNIKADGIAKFVDSGVSSNKCCSMSRCKEAATMRKVDDKKLGVVTNTSSHSCSTKNNVQLINPNIHAKRLLENQSNFAPETAMENSYLCPFCDFVTNDESVIERHFTVDHFDKFCSGKTNEESVKSDYGHWTTPSFCPICGLIFHEYSLLQFHVNGHFREDLQTAGCAENVMNVHTEQTENRGQMIKYSQQMEAECSMSTSEKVGNENCRSCKLPSSFDSDDRSSSTEGVIQKLLSHYNKGHDIKQFWLCSNMDHFSTGADKGWGCGYRNFQMLWSCLTKSSMYKAQTGLSTIPSLQKIQSLLEDAWRKGFDEAGSMHFQRTVLNTKKWIGATEIVTVLSLLKIRCSLVDFHTPTGSNNTHPLLFEWIKHYFQTPEPFKLPLYFQHQGHSRTIVGMEEHHDGSLKVLAFDPGVTHTMMKKFLQMDNATHLLKCLRKSVTDLKQKQYQIVAVLGIMDKSEMEESKILKSTRIP